MKKWVRWTVGMVLGFALLVTLLWQNENRRGKRLWEETCARLRAAGEPVDIADIIPPMIPDEENVAMAPIFAEVFTNKDEARLAKLGEGFRKGELTDLSGRIVERPEAYDRFIPEDTSQLDDWLAYLRAMPSARSPTTSMPPADELLFHLSPWQDTVNELVEAVQRPNCRWPLHYEQGARMENPLMNAAGMASSNLWLWAMPYALKGDSEKHLRIVLTQLRLARWVHHDGSTMLTLLVAESMRSRALASVRQMLPMIAYNDEQLGRLQAELSGITLDDLVKAVRQERVLGCYSWRRITTKELADSFHSTQAFFSKPPFGKGPSSMMSVAGSLLSVAYGHRPQGLNDTDAAIYADFIQDEVLPCIDTTHGTLLRSRANHLDLASKSLTQNVGWLSLHKSNLVGQYLGLLRSEAQTQAMVREALVWCAIERFRLKHGKIPGDLDELVPEFISKAPCDPVNGLPFRYVRRGERDYLLYSIGWNEKDEGGMETRKRDQGDWTWASDRRLIVNPEMDERRAVLKGAREKDAARQSAKAHAKGS